MLVFWALTAFIHGGVEDHEVRYRKFLSNISNYIYA
jgi:hypothetical protein